MFYRKMPKAFISKKFNLILQKSSLLFIKNLAKVERFSFKNLNKYSLPQFFKTTSGICLKILFKRDKIMQTFKLVQFIAIFQKNCQKLSGILYKIAKWWKILVDFRSLNFELRSLEVKIERKFQLIVNEIHNKKKNRVVDHFRFKADAAWSSI